MKIRTPAVRTPIRQLFGQFSRFSLVGGLNTAIDLLAFNLLLWLLPTHDTRLLLLYNACAQCVAALNSFCINKFWTFGDKNPISRQQVMRFTAVVALCFLCNLPLNWCLTNLFVANSLSSPLWMNAAKIIAITGTAILSFLIMRAWTFATNKGYAISDDTLTIAMADTPVVTTTYSLSVVLPVYNAGATIQQTISTITRTLSTWMSDFEVVVINDGSKDRTEKIVQRLCEKNKHIRLISHKENQGYGATLVTGFASAAKELIFFMDADGQFDIRDLARFFPLIEDYDAVLGYRDSRRDSWMRNLNAWGWKQLIRLAFGIRVRDIDCAFKLYRAECLQKHRLETRGTMVNAEMMYHFSRAGYTYTEVGVRHQPLKVFKSKGSKEILVKLTVIFGALREMFYCVNKWYQEEHWPFEQTRL